MGLLFPFQTVTLAAVTYLFASVLRNLKELGNNVQLLQMDLGHIWSGFSKQAARKES